MFMRTQALLFAICAIALSGSPVSARVDVSINVKSQTMDVFVEGQHAYSWKVSTGRRGFSTPGGSYGVKRTARRWYSSKYNNAPMPNSVFFSGGYAIHGTTDIANLGRKASHGCVRLHPSNAAQLYQLVESYGRSQTRISIRH